MQTNSSEPKWILGLEWALLIALIALATYLRYWRLEEVPPGFNSDEAVGAVGALQTLREGIRYSYEGQGGGGVLGFYFAAAAFYLFGPSVASIRGLAAWAAVVGIFAHYWAVREMFRGPVSNFPTSQSFNDAPSPLQRARLIAFLSTLGLSISVWHLQASRIAFAGIGVPFLMMPSIYFLWYGLNRGTKRWPFIVSGLFLGGLMYIYLSGLFVPLVYAAFFIAQWLIIKLAQKVDPAAASRPSPAGRWFHLNPPQPYLTTQFWHLFSTALVSALLLIPIAYVLLVNPELEPGTTRAGQASFLNPNINQGDPWGLLGRSIIGNFTAYGVSPLWLTGQAPRMVLPAPVGLLVGLGFLLGLGRGWRGQAAYLFTWLCFVIMLLPSILSPDSIPHTLRAIGATNPTYILAALPLVWLFELSWYRLPAKLSPTATNLRRLSRGAGLLIALGLLGILWRANAAGLYQYFYVFPYTNDAQAAYHVYAVEMAKTINQDPRSEAAFILPRNTAAGDVNPNFTTDFLTELEQPPAAHYWVIDDERTLAADLTQAASGHSIIRLVTWKTSKHTGADPKEVIPYYLEKYGHYQQTDTFEYFDIDTYRLELAAPNFAAAETLQPAKVNFGDQLQLTGYALGDAGNAAEVNKSQAASNDFLWLRLAWRKIGAQPENLKVSALVYAANGQLITQVDKLLQSNFLQAGSSRWELGAQEATYFLIPLPPATPPGEYTLHLAVYGETSQSRLAIAGEAVHTALLAPFTVRPARRPVEPDALTLALPIKQELLPGLTLLGFETLPGETVYTGSEMWASLLWQGGNPPPAAALEMVMVAEPVEDDDTTILSEPAGLAGPDYPTPAWQPGEVLRGWIKARIPPALEPGAYELNLAISATDQSIAPIILPIGQFQIEGWTRNFEPPQPQVELKADFNDQARLVGVDVRTTEVTPGGTLPLRLYWQAAAEFQENYITFAHLIGPDGLLYGQVDHIPGNGAFPTTGWLPGEYIADEIALTVAANAPQGAYQLAFGLYDPDTGQRLDLSRVACATVSCEEQDEAIRINGLVVK